MGNQVSVVIPTFNRGQFIEEAVKSVLEQQDPGCDYEVIVVDDGSTDDTEARLTQFKDRITYKKIPKSGRPAVPRNVGIELAQGELIAFQDSDDRWVPDKLKRQLPTFADPSIALSYGNAEIMTEKGVKTSRTIITSGEGRSGDIFEALLSGNFISTLTVMARRDVIRGVGGFDESSTLRGIEDYDLWLRITGRHQASFVDETLAYYRAHPGNLAAGDAAALIRLFQSLLRGDLPAERKRQVRKRLSLAYYQSAEVTEGLSNFDLRLRAKYHKLRAG